eukprot:scaffold114_cov361-Pinguiococcus_pyrenoidosus.AAC.1
MGFCDDPCQAARNPLGGPHQRMHKNPGKIESKAVEMSPVVCAISAECNVDRSSSARFRYSFFAIDPKFRPAWQKRPIPLRSRVSSGSINQLAEFRAPRSPRSATKRWKQQTRPNSERFGFDMLHCLLLLAASLLFITYATTASSRVFVRELDSIPVAGRAQQASKSRSGQPACALTS